ncbi:MAG: mechanosensitive ion channel domain-containing protein [Candidatus Saccharibacteria bacterium]
MQQTINNILAITDSKLIKTLTVILLSLLIQKILNIVIKNGFKYTVESNLYPKRKRDQEKRAKTLISIFSTGTTLCIWFIAGLIILNIFNVNIQAVLVSAGFIGAALAFGMQSLIKDFMSGIFIIAENQYRIDDYVQFDKIGGTVENISVRTTILRDNDGSLHYVPNGTIIVATNLSMGQVKANEQVEFLNKITTDQFEEKLKDIALIIKKDESFNKLIKAGPELNGIDKITAKSTTVTITFSTSVYNRSAAATAIWRLIEKQKIPLA